VDQSAFNKSSDSTSTIGSSFKSMFTKDLKPEPQPKPNQVPQKTPEKTQPANSNGPSKGPADKNPGLDIEFQLVGQKQLKTPILFGAALSNRVLASVNSSFMLCVESIERYFLNSYEGGGIEFSNFLTEDERPSDKIGLRTPEGRFYPIFTELFKSHDSFMTFLGSDSAQRIRLIT
jgi:hypothetical protein